MTTYYRSRDLQITHRELVQLRHPRRRFAIADLSGFHVVRHDPVRHRRIPAPVAAAALTVTATTWPLVLDSPAVMFGALVLIGIAAVAVGVWRRNRPRVWELRAVHRGKTVCIYATTDALIFGQVRRALIRAVETNAGL